MGKSIEEMRKYKAQWAREKRIKDPEWAEKDRKKCAEYNKNVTRKGMDAYEKFSLIGRKFGLLTVVMRGEGKKRNSKNWICDCDCGKRGITKPGVSLISGYVRSCGCLKKLSHIIHGETIRGQPRASEYGIWHGLKARCYNKKNPSYPNYGARGIYVCERWMVYKNFLADMGRRPSNKHSIERRENNGIYEPENCYWGTKKEQANNKRTTIILTYNNASHSLKQWSEILNVGYLRLYHLIRIKKHTIEEVVADGSIFANK